MAALPVEIRGTLYDLMTKSSRQVYIVGDAFRSDVGVGGGPIMPPDQGGGSPGSPAFPIWGPPGTDFPDKPGYPPVAGHPLPQPPEGPPEGGQPPDPPTADKPPPAGAGGWGWMASASRWGYFPDPSQAQPKG